MITTVVPSFLVGVICGALGVIVAFIAYASEKKDNLSEEFSSLGCSANSISFREAFVTLGHQKLMETVLTSVKLPENSQSKIPDAIKPKKTLPDAFAAVGADATDLSSSSVNVLEKEFYNKSREVKERHKQYKQLSTYLSEVSKVQSTYGKDLTKLSHMAMSNVKGDGVLDLWWNFLSVALDRHCLECTQLSRSIDADIISNISHVCEEEGAAEKLLFDEGVKFIKDWKEASFLNDIKLKDRDKIRDKMNSNLSKGSSTSLTGGNEKWIQKLRMAECSLDDASCRLLSCNHMVSIYIPRIVADYNTQMSDTRTSVLSILLKFVDSLLHCSENIAAKTNRLRMEMVAVHATGGPGSGYEVDAVTAHALASTIESFEHANEEDNLPKLDLHLETTASFAASSPSILPPLPPRFNERISSETCVWFNALTGRIYRDAVRSAYFHQWVSSRVARMLNKGTKPEYVDDFKVSEVTFGAVPPVLCNVRWLPSPPAPEAGNSDASPEPHNDYDVQFTGDLAFRSGIIVCVSTRIWINFPTKHYASFPATLNLEVTEVIGNVRFGVLKGASFFSFLDEPYTKFRVSTEFGDQYKIKNLPKLSDIVISKIRKTIRNKLVYPNAHKFRLIWPRKWWPEGTHDKFVPKGDDTKGGEVPIFPSPSPASAVQTSSSTNKSSHPEAEAEAVDDVILSGADHPFGDIVNPVQEYTHGVNGGADVSSADISWSQDHGHLDDEAFDVLLEEDITSDVPPHSPLSSATTSHIPPSFETSHLPPSTADTSHTPHSATLWRRHISTDAYESVPTHTTKKCHSNTFKGLSSWLSKKSNQFKDGFHEVEHKITRRKSAGKSTSSILAAIADEATAGVGGDHEALTVQRNSRSSEDVRVRSSSLPPMRPQSVFNRDSDSMQYTASKAGNHLPLDGDDRDLENDLDMDREGGLVPSVDRDVLTMADFPVDVSPIDSEFSHLPHQSNATSTADTNDLSPISSFSASVEPGDRAPGKVIPLIDPVAFTSLIDPVEYIGITPEQDRGYSTE